MSNLRKLKDAKSLRDLAKLLGYKPSALSYILYEIPETSKYITFSIKKKSGGNREIKAPIEKLKKVQRRLSNLLSNCAEELLPENQQIKGDKTKQTSLRSKRAIAHGFKRGLSIASNAALHKKKRYVLNLDIKDFFPSINFGRVRGYFIKNKNFRLDPKVATVIAKIACHDNTLPQGSPCSPIISNMIAQVLDLRLVKLAKKHKCTYSRYADDLTFSTNQTKFPIELAFKKTSKKSAWVIGRKLSNCISRAGFEINLSKTRMQYHDNRQTVTGLVVNKVVNTKSEYYRNARVMCHTLFMTGDFHYPLPKEQEKKEKNFFKRLLTLIKTCFSKKQTRSTRASLSKTPSIKSLEGILNHIYQIKNYRNKFAESGYRKSRHDGYIKPKQDTDTPEYPPLNRNNQYSDESHHVSIDGIKNLYAKFLFFTHFNFLEKPLLFCEGKTDNIYLACALNQLAANYPNLIEKKGKETKLKISFLNRTETVSEMLKLADGASGMKYIMLGYERRMRKYEYKGKKHPVIMIADNDKAGRELLLASKKYGCVPTDPFIHVVDNLYIIPLPNVGKGYTEPEDYFDKATLNETLEGKTFHPKEKGFDENKHYGKYPFAVGVIKKKQSSINFDKFKILFNLINDVILDYQKKI